VNFSAEENYTDIRSRLFGIISANFCGQRCVTWSAQRIPAAVNEVKIINIKIIESGVSDKFLSVLHLAFKT
jgi:hypothetical protein